jgi:hypothetical protein
MQFEPNALRATITRTADKYYVLLIEEREIGGTNRAALERYARTQGYTADYHDGRPKELKALAW